MNKNKQKGFSLLETMVAIGIVSFGLLAILGLANYALRAATTSKMNLVASFLAQEGVEIVRYIRESQPDWNAWYGQEGIDGNYLFQYNDNDLGDGLQSRNNPLKIDNGAYQYNSTTSAPFSRTITLTKLSSEEIKVEVLVAWVEGEQQRSLMVEDRLWNWR